MESDQFSFFVIEHKLTIYLFDLNSCTPNWSASSLLEVTYNWTLISIGFIFPTVFIIASNFLVMKKIRRVIDKYYINLNAREMNQKSLILRTYFTFQTT